MAHDAPEGPRPRRWRGVLLLAAGLVLAFLVAAVGLVLLLAETPVGRAVVAQQLLPRYVLDNGLSVHAERIDGSLLGRFTLRGVTLRDRAGLLATAPRVEVGWSPSALLAGDIRLRRLAVPSMVLLRAPDLEPSPPDEPILPDISLAIEALSIPRLEVRKAVAGIAETLSVDGRLDMRDRRLFLDVKALGQRGDRLALRLDSVPDDDRFDLGARLETVADGLVAALLGIDQPVDLMLAGEGGWARWRGALNARLGPEPVAELGLALDSGRLSLAGTVTPAQLLPEGLRAAVGSRVPLNLSTRPDGPSATRLVGGARLAVGRVGLSVRYLSEAGRLEDGAIEAVLDRPGLLVDGLSGGPVRLRASFAGPLRAPAATLGAEAPALALAAAGETFRLAAPRLEATLDWPQVSDGAPASAAIGFSLRAAAVAPLPDSLSAHAAAPRVTGRLRLDGGVLRAETVRLEVGAGRLVATLDEARLANGRLTLAGRASVRQLRIEGLGAVDAQLDFSGQSDRAGPAVRGEARLTLPAPGDAARALLGGAASARLPFSLARGTLTVAGGSLASPGLSLPSLGGRLALADGRFSLAASGRSADFGPLRLEAEGTPDVPRARLLLAAPGLGLGLRDLELRLAPGQGGLDVALTATGSEGPVAGNGLLTFGAGRPLALDIGRLTAGGIEARGRLVQAGSGPFDGALDLSGPGLDGRLVFSVEQGVQRIDLDATAAQARLPLAVPVRIGAGSARLSFLFAPEGLRITGEAQARNLLRADLALAELAARGSMTGDEGEASVTLAGRWGKRPLALGLGLTFDATGYRAGLKGQVAGVPLQLVGDARLQRDGEGWKLAPARLAVAGGTVDVAGHLGARSRLQLRLADLDLSVLDSAVLASQVRGRLSGAIDWEDDGLGAFPRARASLSVEGVSAEANGTAIPTIDATAEISSTPAGLEAAIEMEGSRGSEGRILVRLQPGPGDTLTKRALSGALSGGVRFFGRAETLWTFANLPDQALSGALGLVADFSGTLGDPQLSGGVRGENLLYRNFAWGTRISQLTLQAQLAGNQVRLLSLSGDVQGGSLSGKGTLTLGDQGVDRVDLAFDLSRARLADSPSTRIIVSGPMTLSGRLVDATLAGKLVIDEGQIRIGQLQSAAATSDIPVRRKGAPLPSAAEARPSRLGYDIQVTARDSVKVSGLGLDSFWGADVRIRGDVATPRVTGEAVMARGTYDFAGRSFEITRGRVGFTGDPLDSQVDIQAVAQSDGFRANVLISGTARRPQLGFTSVPPLPEDEVLARLLFGSSVADLSAPEAIQLAAAVAGLRGGTGGLDPLGRLQRASGIDRIRLTGSDAETGMGTGIAFGERLGRNIYVEVATDTEGNALSRVELTLTRVLSVLAHVTTLGDAGVNLRYTRDY